MDDSYKKLLESKWLDRNPALRYMYRQWEAVREKDWCELLKKSRPLLTIRISPERSFYDALESKGVFNKRTIESFRVRQIFIFMHLLCALN